MVRLIEDIKDMIFPRRCPICDEVLDFRQGLIHKACQAKLRYITEPFCLKCGKPILTKEETYCVDCGKRKHVFTSGRSIWVYDEQMRKSIAAYKYHGRREYADFFILQMLAMQGNWLKSLNVDAVMGIPLNWKKKNRRGYNQAGILAEGIARRIGSAYDEKYIRRSSWTEPQKTLSPLQRYENLKKAFCVHGIRGRYHNVLLVDDIYTSGSTMDACAKVLLDAGIQNVYFISLCIGSDKAG